MSRNGITLLVFVYLPCDGTRWLKRMRWIAAAKVVSISRKTSQTSHSWHGGWYKRVRDQEINWTQQGTPIHTAGPHQTSWLRTYDEILTSPRKINRWHDWTGIGQISDSCKGETLTCCHDECSLPFARFADFWVCTSVRTSTCTANLAIGCLKQFQQNIDAKHWWIQSNALAYRAPIEDGRQATSRRHLAANNWQIVACGILTRLCQYATSEQVCLIPRVQLHCLSFKHWAAGWAIWSIWSWIGQKHNIPKRTCLFNFAAISKGARPYIIEET